MKGKPNAALAARIREQMTTRHLSYRKLGTAIGVSGGQAFKYAHGVHRITDQMLARIAAALDCDVGFLKTPPPGTMLNRAPGSPLMTYEQWERLDKIVHSSAITVGLDPDHVLALSRQKAL